MAEGSQSSKRKKSKMSNVSRRARAMCDGRASARVLSDKSMCGGSPIGGPARRHWSLRAKAEKVPPETRTSLI